MLSGGQHLYAVIDNPLRAKELNNGVMRLAWIVGEGSGRGFLKIAKDGKALMRGPVDVSTASSERLIYEGPPVVERPIVATDPRIAEVFEGGVLDVDAFMAFVDAVAPEDTVQARPGSARRSGFSGRAAQNKQGLAGAASRPPGRGGRQARRRPGRSRDHRQGRGQAGP